MTLFGDGEELRDHVHIDDVVGVIVGTMARRSEGLLNVASGRSVSFAAIVEQFAHAVGRPLTRATLARSVPMTHLHYDAALKRQAFPDIPWTSLADGVGRFVAGRRTVAGCS